MVFVEYKQSEKNKFTINCDGNTVISDVLKQIIFINNIRLYLERLIWGVDQLANKGVLKPHDLQGVSYEDYEKHINQFDHLTPEQKMYGKKPEVYAPMRYVPDKHSQRYGLILPQGKHKDLLIAVQYAKKVMIGRKQVISQKQLGMMKAYPGYLGLPAWEPSLLLLQQKLPLEVMESENYQLFNEKATLWWAGKQLHNHDRLSKYCGKNEKTRIIVKVQKKGAQLPLRQPPIDTETYQKMVKYYYKKVEETKQMEKNSLDTHYDEVKTTDLKTKVYLDKNEVQYQPM